LFPQVKFVRRGKMNLEDVFLTALSEGASLVFIVDSKRKEPSRIRIYLPIPDIENALVAQIMFSKLRTLKDMGEKPFKGRLKKTAVVNDSTTEAGAELEEVLCRTMSLQAEKPKGEEELLNMSYDSYFAIRDLSERYVEAVLYYAPKPSLKRCLISMVVRDVRVNRENLAKVKP